MSITASLSYHADRKPYCDALVFEEQRITWRELDTEVRRLARFIDSAAPRDKGIALHLPTSPALALLFLAIARAGREALVLDPDSPDETNRAILSELSPSMIVSSGARLDKSSTILANPFLHFSEVASVLGASNDAGVSFEPDDLTPFYVGFTSGSTGIPKGFRRHHRSWMESFRHDALEFGITANDVILAPGTLTHSLFLYAMVHGLNVGARVILSRRFRPDATVRLIASEKATVLYGVPTQLQLVIRAACFDPLASVRWVLSSGAKWPTRERELLQSLFPNARFAEFYGASETSFMTVAKADEGIPETSVGRAFSGAAVTIRDDGGRHLPPGDAGYVFVESPFLFMDYACGEASDLRRQGHAISVGDIGFLDSKGFLHLVGRAGRKIVTSGKNVYPEEIERVLERYPGVTSAAVLGVPDPVRGERLVALLNLKADGAVPSSQLISHLRDALPLYMVPRVYAIVPDWPLTRSGKTDFNGLRKSWLDGKITERLP